MELHYPKSRGNIEGWASIRQNQGATPERCVPSAKFKGPHESVQQPNSRGHEEACKSITKTQEGHIEGGLHHGNSKGRMTREGPPTHQPNSTGGTKTWESIARIQRAALKHGSLSTCQGATPQCVSPLVQLMGPHRTIGVLHAISRGQTEGWESIIPTQRATLKREVMDSFASMWPLELG